MLFDLRLPSLGLLNDHYLLIGSKVNSRKKGCAGGKSIAMSGCLKLDLEAILTYENVSGSKLYGKYSLVPGSGLQCQHLHVTERRILMKA